MGSVTPSSLDQSTASDAGRSAAGVRGEPASSRADSRAEPVLAEGRAIAGKYVIEGQLGSGGMGIVFAARHLALATPLAIKVLHPGRARSPDAVRRFLREARAASELAGPHVARAIDAGTLDDGLPYVVMERLAGADLERTLRAEGPLPIARAARYVREACAGLATAHARGFVHRDVKPSNLFLARCDDDVERIKVLDFGIAKAREANDGDASLTATDSAIGSPSYMSPEQVRDAKSVDARADVWALGATLFKLLTGELPFRGDSPMSMSAAITADPPRRVRPLRPEVPPALEAIVLRCLRKECDERFASVLELAEALAPFASGAAVVDGARSRGRRVAAASIAAAAVIGATWLALRARPSSSGAHDAPGVTTEAHRSSGAVDAPPLIVAEPAPALVAAAAVSPATSAPARPAPRPRRTSVVAAAVPVSPPPPDTVAEPAPLASAPIASSPPSKPPAWSGGSATDDRE